MTFIFCLRFLGVIKLRQNGSSHSPALFCGGDYEKAISYYDKLKNLEKNDAEKVIFGYFRDRMEDDLI